MKNRTILFSILFIAITGVACDENEIMPSFVTKGTATHTMADISVSNTAPPVSENVTVLISYVNPSADPLKTITVRAKVGDADYVDIQRFDVGSEVVDEIATKAISYVAPATPATTVVFDMIITSQKEYPQIKQTKLKTK